MRPLVVVTLVAACAGVGCASARPAPIAAADDELQMPERLPPPESPAESQGLLSGAMAAMRAGQPLHAAVFLDAILRSDLLTERGRASVYWMAAEAWAAAGRDPERLDCLGGFLVSSSFLDPDDVLLDQQRQARAALLANRVQQDPHLGSEDSPIAVVDPRDPAELIAALGCGTTGENTKKGALEGRPVVCMNAERVLWFSLEQ